MKILFISDTHGSLSELKALLYKEYDADLYLHLGDVLGPSEEIAPFVAVRGNCDSSLYHYPFERELTLPSGKKMLLRHHPLSCSKEAEELKERGYSYFLHGHTHKREDLLLPNGLRSLCPGSLSYPRDGEYCSYLVFKADPEGENWEFKKL